MDALIIFAIKIMEAVSVDQHTGEKTVQRNVDLSAKHVKTMMFVVNVLMDFTVFPVSIIVVMGVLPICAIKIMADVTANQ
jgi:hypothetical protein